MTALGDWIYHLPGMPCYEQMVAMMATVVEWAESRRLEEVAPT